MDFAVFEAEEGGAGALFGKAPLPKACFDALEQVLFAGNAWYRVIAPRVFWGGVRGSDAVQGSKPQLYILLCLLCFAVLGF